MFGSEYLTGGALPCRNDELGRTVDNVSQICVLFLDILYGEALCLLLWRKEELRITGLFREVFWGLNVLCWDSVTGEDPGNCSSGEVCPEVTFKGAVGNVGAFILICLGWVVSWYEVNVVVWAKQLDYIQEWPDIEIQDKVFRLCLSLV